MSTSGGSPPQGFSVGDVTDMRFSQARGLFDSGRWMEALVEAEELLDESPDHLNALFLVGEACLELGDAYGAEAAYSRFLELAPGETGALTGLAIARYELTDMDGCLSCTRQTLDLDPSIPEAWYFQGLALQWLELGSDSETALEKACKIDSARFPLLVLCPDSAWERALGDALSLFEAQLGAWLQQIPIVTELLPGLDVLRTTSPPLSPFSPGLFCGQPPDPGLDAWENRPEEARLYRSNIERLALHGGEIHRRIAEVLRSEALDWLGLPLEAHPLKS